MLTVFINEGIKMDKCHKNMTLVALNIFELITILDIFVFGLLGSTTGRGPKKEKRDVEKL